MSYAIKILDSDNENTIKFGGYGVVFGGRDLEGDTFTKNTEFSLDTVPVIPTFYDHAQSEIKSEIGKSMVKMVDDIGVFFETELEKSHKYMEQILKLIESGVLGYSTGAVSHLVSRDRGHIKNWPVYEISLTATPAEPRTIGVDTVKTNKGELIMDTQENVETVEDFGAELKAIKSELDALKSIKINKLDVAGDSPKAVVNDEVKSFAQYARSGGSGEFEVKALNITTATQGQETVPEGFYSQVIARIEEANPLHSALGVRMIPGQGTTVQVPVEDSAGGVLVATTESAAGATYEPTFAQVPMTYASYRGQVSVTNELLQDNDVALVEFLSGRFARMATNTLNSALITEVLTNGTSLHTFASTTAIAAGELEQIVSNDTIAPYVEQGQSNFVMKASTNMAIQSIDGNRFYSDGTGSGQVGDPMLIGYPVKRSAYAPAIALGLKSVLFGNFDYVGFRMADGLTILRDPYSRAANGEVVFHVEMRFVFKVLQAGAVGYGIQAAA